MASPFGNNRRTSNVHTSEQPDTTHDWTEFITVLVGDDRKDFKIHKHILCSKYTFFETACQDRRWTEGQDGVVCLPEHGAQAFEVFVFWAYSGKVNPDLGMEKEIKKRPYGARAEAWASSDFLGATTLSNLLLDECLAWTRDHNQWSGATCIREVDEGTSIWRLWVDIVACKGASRYMSEEWKELAPDVLLDIAKKFMAGETKVGVNPFNEGRCYYHDHSESEGAAKCG